MVVVEGVKVEVKEVVGMVVAGMVVVKVEAETVVVATVAVGQEGVETVVVETVVVETEEVNLTTLTNLQIGQIRQIFRIPNILNLHGQRPTLTIASWRGRGRW